tara:strand:+ start:9153 stop:10745 length:1593 start_codon:yes stop_codon:yes gene_type:complete
MARNRVIYQSEALFVSPNATGAHFTCSAVLTGGGVQNTLGYEMHSILPVGVRVDPILNLRDSTASTASEAKVAAKSNLSNEDLFNISGQVSATEPFASVPVDSIDVNDTAAIQHGVSYFTNLANWQTFQNNNASTAKGDRETTGVFLQPASGTYNNLIQQLHRVQSANYSFTINRTDVNTFGQLARIDAIALEPPTVNLDFTYYPTDGFNERNLGFYVQGADDKGEGMGADALSAAKGHLQDDSAGRNFFILTTPEGTDAFNTTRDISERSVIGLGNGYLSDYTIEASVGSIPTASATVELFNAKSDKGTTGVEIPGVTLDDGKAITGTQFSLGQPTGMRGDSQGAAPSTGDVGATALRPGDITLEIPQGLSIFADVSGDGEVHIQNFNLSLPLSRSPIDRLGTRFAFSRVVDFPVVATMSISALISEVSTGNLANIIDDCEERDVRIRMKANQSCGVGEASDSMIIDFKGARIDSESISSDIGSNKSVDLTFTTQIGGPEDTDHGVLISGANRSVITGHFGMPALSGQA